MHHIYFLTHFAKTPLPSHACGEKTVCDAHAAPPNCAFSRVRRKNAMIPAAIFPSRCLLTRAEKKLGIQPHEDDTVSAFSRVRRKNTYRHLLRCDPEMSSHEFEKKTYYLLSDLLNCDAFSGGERRRYAMLSGFLISARSKFSKRYHVPSLFCLNTIGRGLSAPLERM
jgi:hypothetical protein